MKRLFLFTLSLATITSLNARENPFIPTAAYEEEARLIQEQQELETQAAREQAYINEMQKMMQAVKPDGTIPTSLDDKTTNKNNINKKSSTTSVDLTVKPKITVNESTIDKREVQNLINKVQKDTEQKTRKIVQKETKQLIEKELKKIQKEQITKEVVFVKPRKDVIEEVQTYKPLPFIEVTYSNHDINIKTKYKMKETFNLEEQNKIIIDFSGYTKFYTKRKNLNTTNFENIAIGNHMAKRFFRVVIKTSNNPNNYTIKQQNGLVTISSVN